MSRVIVCAFVLTIAYCLTHRPSVGCALVDAGVVLDRLGERLIPDIEMPNDIRDRQRLRLMTACQARRNGSYDPRTMP